MDNKLLSLQHLETLSSADLIAIADDYGIDIPDNLNRRFIIGELLEVGEEIAQEEKDNSEMVEDSSSEAASDAELPLTFNETEIQVILRNPAWAYVYWDISTQKLKDLASSDSFERFILRVSYFENEEDQNPVDFFDIKIEKDLRSQYILLENGKKYFRVDLVALFDDGTSDNLAVSRKVRLPETPEILKKAKPGAELNLPPLLRLSGMEKLLEISYKKYRESFTE